MARHENQHARFSVLQRWLLLPAGLLLLYASSLHGQINPTGLSAPALGFSAWYDFPGSIGAIGSVRSTFFSRQKPIIRPSGAIREKVISWSAGIDLGFYHYPLNQNGVVGGGSLLRTRSSEKRFSLGSRCGIGIWRTFYAGGLYSLNAQGQVTRTTLGGRIYGYANLGLPLAWALGPNRLTTLKIEPLLWIQFPYNSFILPHPSLVFGLTRSFQRTQPRAGNNQNLR